jgi:hypothetical protein
MFCEVTVVVERRPKEGKEVFSIVLRVEILGVRTTAVIVEDSEGWKDERRAGSRTSQERR